MKQIMLLTTAIALAGCAGQGPGLFNNTGQTPPPAAGNGQANANGENPDANPAANTNGTTDTAQNTPPNPAPNTNTVVVNNNGTTVTPAPTPDPPAPEPVQTVEVTPTPTPAPAPANNVPSDGRLGTTVVSLGDPAETGFWLVTPLVDNFTVGRVIYPGTGRPAQVELRPAGGGGSGSQMSIAAMKMLGIPLDGLEEVVVYAN